MLLYWLAVFPRARHEVHEWERRAATIDDPVLREHALGKLRSERLVAEGAAAFAILAVSDHRAAVVRVCVAYEVLYDLLDAIGEEVVDDPLAHNRCLHGALRDALSPAAPVQPRYGLCFQSDDGGYIRELVAACRDALRELPAADLVVPALERFALRAGEAQSLNHAAAYDVTAGLACWAESLMVADAHWWEVAAAASDPLGVFALVAAASDPRTTATDVTAIEASYFPWIGALTWLMESLVDYGDDLENGDPSYVARYGSPEVAGSRLATIASRAGAAARALPGGSRHVVLLAGVVSLYLSAPGAGDCFALDATRRIRRSVGGPVTPLLLVLRLRRWLRRPRLQRARP